MMACKRVDFRIERGPLLETKAVGRGLGVQGPQSATFSLKHKGPLDFTARYRALGSNWGSTKV